MQLQELLNDYQMYHSDFQRDHFIVGSQGTMYAQYKQALREVFSRVENLKNLFYEKEKLEIEIDEQEHLSKSEANEFKKRYAELEFRQKKARLISLNFNMQESEKELRRFFTNAAYLKTELEKEHGELTKETKKDLEEDMWVFKAKEMIITSILIEGKINTQTFEFINHFPKDIRTTFMENIKNKDHQIDMDKLVPWYDDQKQSFIPEDLENIQIPELEKQIKDIKQNLIGNIEQIGE